MKKLFTLALACSFFATNVASAQTEEKYYGAENGGFALTIGADPVINFVGNMFNGTIDNSLEDLGGTIAGKLFVTDKFALNAELGINNFKTKKFTYEDKKDKNYGEYEELTSTETEGYKNFSIGLGAQYYLRPGKRLQPFVGASILYGRTNDFYNVESFDYEFEDRWKDEYRQYEGYAKSSSPMNTFALMANIGVEYFLRQNISISATLDLDVRTDTYKEVMKFDTEDRDYEKEDIEKLNYSYKSNKSTYFATGLMASKIAFNFYF